MPKPVYLLSAPILADTQETSGFEGLIGSKTHVMSLIPSLPLSFDRTAEFRVPLIYLKLHPNGCRMA